MEHPALVNAGVKKPTTGSAPSTTRPAGEIARPLDGLLDPAHDQRGMLIAGY